LVKWFKTHFKDFIMWGAIIGGVMSLASAAGQSGAAQDAKRVAKLNAGLTMEETNEQQRRMQTDIDQTEGIAKAISAASGVQMSGSRKIAVDEMQSENIKQLQWLRKSGIRKAKVVQLGGQLQSSQLKSQAAASAFSGAAQIAQGLFSSGGK
jgi:hypothetical protein